MDTIAWLDQTLRAAFTPVHLVVEDESAAHVGHPGATGGGHYRVLIVADGFRGLDPVSRQRAVYSALGDGFKSRIHALALRTLAPEEWHAEGIRGSGDQGIEESARRRARSSDT
jgi:BolA protein